MRVIFALMALTAVLSLVPESARADRRIFGYVYPFQTLPQGSRELEHYLDMGIAPRDNPATIAKEARRSEVDWRHQAEFEYGITDRIDLGVYQVFRQKPYSSLTYDGMKVRSRLRLGDEGDHLLDVALYGEVGYFGDSAKAEEMLILSKHWGALEWACNLKVEQEVELAKKELVQEFKPLMGLGYHLWPSLAVGVEGQSTFVWAGGEGDYEASFAGPVLSLAMESFFWTVSLQPQLGDKAGVAEFQVRSLFGVNF